MMDKNQKAPAILRVPLEIRDAIYSDLLDLCQVPGDPKLIHPGYKAGASPFENEDSLFSVRFGYYHRLRICYDDAPPKYQLLPILQTCHQIRIEFQDFLRRIQSNPSARSQWKGLRYELNVYAYLLRAYPVWTVLPLPPEEPYNVIDELRVNYEVRDFMKSGGRFHDHQGTGSEPYTPFYLLSNFLFHGPQGFYIPAINDLPPQGCQERSRYDGGRCQPKIKHLVLNITFEKTSTQGPSIRIAELRADVKSGKPGAQAALEEALEQFTDSKLSVAGFFEFNICEMVNNNYFDGYLQKVSVYFEGMELWKRQWGQERPLVEHSYAIDRGFDRAPDWKESERFLEFDFHWGPRRESQKNFQDELQEGEVELD
ncbi:hypothetical protein TWF481_000225 [Arthrobotrys musiformis]|uniref:Uncharacterized protein n=1 Tax=Arthrobotrys musiformis TaxID=47236 RepID=A0AAV9WM01_9PEZI